MFTDSSKRSLKCVFLHNSNMYAPIPIGHSTTLKEIYDAIKTVLQHIKYEHEKGELFVGSAEWVHKVSLLSMLFGQQG